MLFVSHQGSGRCDVGGLSNDGDEAGAVAASDRGVHTGLLADGPDRDPALACR
eukprot:COSAG06_NODE_23171_length_700_cov_3.570715_1_plen_52_part_10